jgi:hypothetical protein
MAKKKKATKKATKKRAKATRAGARTLRSKRAATKKKLVVAKRSPASKTKKKKKIARKKAASRPSRSSSFDTSTLRAATGSQAGDVQGLSNTAGADSESVDELVEEGNAFEADVVSGVEEAGNQEGREVHTHEVPEDDVPGEYLDEQ